MKDLCFMSYKEVMINLSNLTGIREQTSCLHTILSIFIKKDPYNSESS